MFDVISKQKILVLSTASQFSKEESQSTSKQMVSRLLPLDVTINATPVGQWLLLERNNILYASDDAFKEWRLQRQDNVQMLKAHGKQWIALSSLAGFQAKFNEENQSVILTFPANAFVSTKLQREPLPSLNITPASTVGFVNYDLSFTSSHIRSSTFLQSTNGLFDLGISGNWGVLSSSYVGQNLMASDISSERSFRRIETVLNRDFPTKNLTLRLGDSTTRPGVFNESITFSGFQLARNFLLRPGFITQPIPALTGVSGAPSTVDLYINEVLRQSTNVPAGPFTIDNLPLITGSGDVQLVLKDALGRETLITQPFFTHANLLEQGLSDWGIELGWIRRNLGIDNANYGPGFFSMQWRQGVNKLLTAQLGLQLSSIIKRASTAMTYALPFQALGTISLANSQYKTMNRPGQKWAIGLEKTTSQHRFTLRTEGADRYYRELGGDMSTLPNHLQTSANYSYTSTRLGTIGIAYAQVNTFNQGNLNTLSANYSTRIGKRGSLSFIATKVVGNITGHSLSISSFLPLDNNITLSANATQSDGSINAYVSAGRALSSDIGSSWRVLAGTRGGTAYSEGGIYYRGDKQQLNADISTSAFQQVARLGAKGGIVLIDNHFFMTRRIENSFALVKVPGYANVGISFQGNSRGRTGQDGKVLLTDLQPYQENHIQLDPKTLPVNAELDNIEQVVIPSARTGIKITFPVHIGRAALVRIILDEDKKVAPIGAEVELLGTNKTFFVVRQGLAFITDLQSENRLRLRWKEKTCDFPIILPVANPNNIVRIGPIICSGVSR